MVATLEPRNEASGDVFELGVAESTVIEDYNGLELVVWTVRDCHEDGRITLTRGGGSTAQGRPRPDRQLEAVEVAMGFHQGLLAPFSPQLGELTLMYSRGSDGEKPTPRIVQVIDYGESASQPLLHADDHVSVWNPLGHNGHGSEYGVSAWRLAPLRLPARTRVIALVPANGPDGGGPLMAVVAMLATWCDAQLHIPESRTGAFRIQVRPIFNGQPLAHVVSVKWTHVRLIDMAVTTYCSLPPMETSRPAYAVNPRDLRSWAQPLVYFCTDDSMHSYPQAVRPLRSCSSKLAFSKRSLNASKLACCNGGSADLCGDGTAVVAGLPFGQHGVRVTTCSTSCNNIREASVLGSDGSACVRHESAGTGDGVPTVLNYARHESTGTGDGDSTVLNGGDSIAEQCSTSCNNIGDREASVLSSDGSACVRHESAGTGDGDPTVLNGDPTGDSGAGKEARPGVDCDGIGGGIAGVSISMASPFATTASDANSSRPDEEDSPAVLNSSSETHAAPTALSRCTVDPPCLSNNGDAGIQHAVEGSGHVMATDDHGSGTALTAGTEPSAADAPPSTSVAKAPSARSSGARYCSRQCSHCGMLGHLVDRCWKLHPQLRRKTSPVEAASTAPASGKQSSAAQTPTKRRGGDNAHRRAGARLRATAGSKSSAGASNHTASKEERALRKQVARLKQDAAVLRKHLAGLESRGKESAVPADAHAASCCSGQQSTAFCAALREIVELCQQLLAGAADSTSKVALLNSALADGFSGMTTPACSSSDSNSTVCGEAKCTINSEHCNTGARTAVGDSGHAIRGSCTGGKSSIKASVAASARRKAAPPCRRTAAGAGVNMAQQTVAGQASSRKPAAGSLRAGDMLPVAVAPPLTTKHTGAMAADKATGTARRDTSHGTAVRQPQSQLRAVRMTQQVARSQPKHGVVSAPLAKRSAPVGAALAPAAAELGAQRDTGVCKHPIMGISARSDDGGVAVLRNTSDAAPNWTAQSRKSSRPAVCCDSGGTALQSTPLLDTHGRSSALSCATDGGGAPGSTQCSDGHEGSAPGITPLTVCEHGDHAQSPKLRAGSCSRAVGPGSLSLDNGVDDSAQSLVRCANMIGGRRDATHSTAALSGGQGHDDTQVLVVAVGAAGELGVHRRKVRPFTGTDESSTVPTQGLAQTAGIADGDRMACNSEQLPGNICNARSSAATIGANIQSSVPRTEGISSSAHGFAQYADAGGGNGDGVAGLALLPAGDTGAENSTQLAGNGGGRDAISPSRSPTVPSAGSSITDSTPQPVVSSHDTAHGSAPLCDGHGRVIQVCTCAAVDGVAERCDCHTQTLSSEPQMESADSNAQGLAKSAGASGNHGDGACGSGPLSTQSFAQSAVDGGDGGVGSHSSVPLSVSFDGGTHDSGVISTAHGFAPTSGVTGAGQCSSFHSAQSLVSQAGTASNGTANAITLSLVGGHAGILQGSHAAQAITGHDGTLQPLGMGSGPTKGVEQSRMGGCSTLLLEAASNVVQDLHTGALLEQQAISSHPPSRPGCCVGTLSSSLSSVGGRDIVNDDTAASAGTGNSDLLLQHGGTARAALNISQTAQLGLRTGKLLPHQAHKALQQQRSALPHQQQASAMQQLRSAPVQRSSSAQHEHQRQLLLAAPQPQQCSVLTDGTCFHQALCPKVQWAGSPTPTHMVAGPRTEEAALVPANGIDDASVPFDPGICSKVYATVPAAMGVSSKPPATRISDSLSRDAGLNGEVQLPLLPLTVQRCTECTPVTLLSSTSSNAGTGVASCHSSEGSASFGEVGSNCGVLAPLTAAPNSHDPIAAVSNMVIATASPGLVYSSEGGTAVSISTSNEQRSIAGSPSAVECNMEAVQLVAVMSTAGACRLAEAVRRKAMVLVQQGTARAGITASTRCTALVPVQHSPMTGRTAMTTRSIDPREEAARNNGSYTGHTSGEDETHTVGSCVAICDSGGKAYSFAVLRGDEVRTHDVVVSRGGEKDVRPMAHTAVMRQKAHGDVVARGFEDKEPNATGEVGGSSGVQAVPRRAMMRTPAYASRARARATVATEEIVVSSNRAHVRRWRLTADLVGCSHRIGAACSRENLAECPRRRLLSADTTIVVRQADLLLAHLKGGVMLLSSLRSSGRCMRPSVMAIMC
ncbi:hypothetical protein JKP88DRAFT_246703 [Tribonema minus]|uniref:Uncharacterized protein n=1 Tax=Tribonema minus TaxID=303371 RepID=A0A835Z1L8_9STRA|nr:hypothetical protein JKP88DRAFT_246703 [Tribonema minus]